MRALVIGASGTIGKRLVNALESAGAQVTGTTRRELDLLVPPPDMLATFGHQDVIYICAAMTRFIDCEANPEAYRINVDGPVAIAYQARKYAKIVYLSSEAAERALHTNYGMHKALAEANLRAVCEPIIARISKVDPWSLDSVCAFLVKLASAPCGVYRWSAPARISTVQALAA